MHGPCLLPRYDPSFFIVTSGRTKNKTHVLTTGILNEVVRTSAQAFAKRMQHKTAKSFPIFTEPPHNASSQAELTPAIISMRRSDILLGINGGSN